MVQRCDINIKSSQQEAVSFSCCFVVAPLYNRPFSHLHRGLLIFMKKKQNSNSNLWGLLAPLQTILGATRAVLLSLKIIYHNMPGRPSPLHPEFPSVSYKLYWIQIQDQQETLNLNCDSSDLGLFERLFNECLCRKSQASVSSQKVQRSDHASPHATSISGVPRAAASEHPTA